MKGPLKEVGVFTEYLVPFRLLLEGKITTFPYYIWSDLNSSAMVNPSS